MKVDFHNHHYPQEYLRILQEKKIVDFSDDADGRKIMTDKGARIVTITEAMTDLTVRLEDMDKAGVDIHVLSLTTPNVYFDDPVLAKELARASNEEFAKIVSRFPERFLSFASVPLNHPDLAIDELTYALDELKMNGVAVGTNILGKYLDDARFEDFFTLAAQRNAPVFLHPMSPWGKELMGDLGLAPLVGFVFDTTLTVARMIFSGVLERIPDLQLILPHTGGTLPFLWERLNNGWRAYAESRKKCPHPPEHYLKKMYYDAVSFHRPALQEAYETVGASQIVLGSDYPHVIGDLPRAIGDVEALNIQQDEKDLIFSGNARRLLINLGNPPLRK
ncbi:MAG TPA: amidohydrolase [Firmicutes bacterium]|jgi:aminocarboxymuconate-semialdehyde decarboxylase|nr:amidohydrolase [Bacillota bacterium]